MGYGTDIRLITTKQGYKELKKYINENSQNNHGLEDLLDYADINKKIRDLVLLGWTDLRGNGREAVEEITSDLYDKDISFRCLCLGDNMEDIEQSDYTSLKDKDKYIPYINMIREFDDKYLNKELKEYAKYYDKQKNLNNEMEE